MNPSRLALLFVPAISAFAADPAIAILQSRCAGCHTGKFAKAGLDLSSRDNLLRGGERGPSIVPGNAKASLLYKVIAGKSEPRMPFQSAALPEESVTVIERWIDSGAEFTSALKMETKSHWSFDVPTRPAVPAVSRSRNPIDAFLAAERDKRGIKPAPPADARTLVRRAFLDVLGVPPSREELNGFLNDAAPAAYERLIERLLADSRYGERWGRHWMDIWRYSDWYGYRRTNEVRNSAKFLWRWRDWIVESLNSDKSYARMIVEMLAGDEVAPNDPQTLRATGFLARNYSRFDRHGWMQDAVDHTAMGFLGVTLKCARCHDHRYDPFKQDEYYKFRAFFEPYQVRADRVPGQLDTDKDGISRVFDQDASTPTYKLIRGDIQNPDSEHPLTPGVPASLGGALPKIEPVVLSVDAYYPDHREFVHTEMLAKAKADLAKAQAALTDNPKDNNDPLLASKTFRAAKAFLPALESRIAADNAKYANAANAEELSDKARKLERQAGVLKADEDMYRAQLELTAALANPEKIDEKKTAAAQKAIDAAKTALTQQLEGYTPIGKAYPERSSGRRLALAQWIASERNPLTARVAVNHMWLRHFGRALVPTVFDFGMNGKPPSHPALLDFLAAEFMDSGWSMKRIHRLILTSEAYRMRSSFNSPANNADPENIYLWRMNPRRMEAEVVRDSVLAAAGALDTRIGGHDEEGDTSRRSIYLTHSPDIDVPFLKLFDSPNPVECYQRSESVAPQQALALANSELTLKQAEALAKRLWDVGGETGFVTSAFETVLGRPPSDEERATALQFIREHPDEKTRASLVHVLFNHNDFVTIR